MSQLKRTNSIKALHTSNGVDYVDSIGLVYISSNETSYFSGCESEHIKRKIGDKEYKTLLEVIKPLHLCDINGIPIHAYENGLFYINNPDDYAFEIVQKHFRLGVIDTGLLIDMVLEDPTTLLWFIETQKERWLEEAINAIQYIDDLNKRLIEESTQRVQYINGSGERV